FAVVAAEVRSLAQQSSQAATDIGTNIQQLTAKLHNVMEDDSALESDVDDGVDLAHLTAGAETAMAHRLGTVAEAQRAMADLVGEVLADTTRAVDQVAATSAALSESTTGAVGEIQFQDITRQVVEHVRHALDELGQQLQDARGLAEGRVQAAEVLAGVRDVDDLRHLHVMDRQRRSHAAATGGGAATTALPDIELF
ncbi:MAG TPA: methyl-accepting chemotaxis protein, partial [Pilimelia sp.]|nr:methyl-accepting chemotaxis protein [Pilimelia sp.]